MIVGLKAQPCFLKQGCESQVGTDGFDRIGIGIQNPHTAAALKTQI